MTISSDESSRRLTRSISFPPRLKKKYAVNLRCISVLTAQDSHEPFAFGFYARLTLSKSTYESRQAEQLDWTFHGGFNRVTMYDADSVRQRSDVKVRAFKALNSP